MARALNPRNANMDKTHCLRGHELAGENLYVHRDRRQCRACQRERTKRYMLRRQQTNRKAYIPRSTRKAVFERDDNRCRVCGATEMLELDHIVLESEGGSHDLDNLRVACRHCNRSRNRASAA